MFWVLEEKFGSDFRADVTTSDPKSVLAGMSGASEVCAKWSSGRTRPGPVIWTESLSLLIHESVAKHMSEAGLTGWFTLPASLACRDGSLRDDYLALCIRGRCGPRDKSMSWVDTIEVPVGERRVVKGLFIDESAWDGTDLSLYTTGELFIMCTDRTRSALQALELRNLEWTPASDVVLSSGPERWPWGPDGPRTEPPRG